MTKKENWTIDGIRKQFINPRSGDEAVDLGVRASYLLAGMGMIYGEFRDKPLPERFLHGLGEDDLGNVLAEMLRRESQNRRFDEKFMGQIHPQGSSVAILAKLVSGYMNTNTIVQEVSQAEHEMEYVVLDWMAKLFGYDVNNYSGNLVSGGSTANLSGLWVAREKLIHKLRKHEGSDYHLRDKVVVLASDMKHYSIEKGTRILGENVHFEKIKSRNFKVDVQAMRESLQSYADQNIPVMAIVGIAGETETGMVEDLAGLAGLAREYGVHFHVDAAYGGPFILTNKELFTGIQDADSITIDPHKLLYTPYSAGAILFKDKHDHSLVQDSDVRYLQPEPNEGVLGPREKRNFGLAARVEGSMGPDAVLMSWATLQLFGESGIKVILEHATELTKLAFQRTKESALLTPLHNPETNTLLVTLRNPESLARMKLIRDSLEKNYGYYVNLNGKVNYGEPAYRLVFMHPWMNNSDVLDMFDKLEEEIINIA